MEEERVYLVQSSTTERIPQLGTAKGDMVQLELFILRDAIILEQWLNTLPTRQLSNTTEWELRQPQMPEARGRYVEK